MEIIYLKIVFNLKEEGKVKFLFLNPVFLLKKSFS